jgi:DNA polymerase
MDDLGWLRLHIEWGADEALDTLPRDRLTRALAVATAVMPVPVPMPAAPPLAVAPAGLAGGALARARELAAGADTLEALRAALEGFSDCPLQPTAFHLVFGDGDAAAGLMLIGDTPGEAEDRSGRPFSGPAGQLLDRMLASIGIDRTQVWLTTAIPWRPPGNRPPTEHERALCLPFLHRQIALVRPRRLLLLGTPAAASLIPGTAANLRKLRGRWQSVTVSGLLAPVAALPTVSPELALTTPSCRKDAWTDLLTLRIALNEDAAPSADSTQS